MNADQLLADRKAFVAHLLVEKSLLERCLASIDAAIHIYTTGNVVNPPPLPVEPAIKVPPRPSSDATAAKKPVAARGFANPAGKPLFIAEPDVVFPPPKPVAPPANDRAPTLGDSAVVVQAKEPKMFTPGRNNVIAKHWPKGMPLAEIVEKCNAIPGTLVTPERVVIQARTMGFHARDVAGKPPVQPLPPLARATRAEVMAKVSAAIEDKPEIEDKPAPKAVDPGEAIAVDFVAVKQWADARNIRFDTWDDLPRVNERRDTLNYPRFKRDFGRRLG